MSGMGEYAYCTLLMSDSYLPGAAVLAKSLRDNGTKKKLAALVTPDSLLPSTITALKEIYDHVIPVDRIASRNLENLARLDRLDLRFAFTKIALWKQIQFRKIVYLDADVIALRAPDELFHLDTHFAAAPDIGWPDIFNSGVMALTPSMSEYWSLHTLASSGTSFDGADQGLLNEYFGNRPWHRLSFTYNCTPSASYQYEPAYRHFRSSISMVHFIGKTKPWMDGRQALTAGTSGGVYQELLGKWWSTYDRYYHITSASALGQPVSGVRTIQHYVKGEHLQSASDWAATGQLSGNQPPPPTPSYLPTSIPSHLNRKALGHNMKLPLIETTDTAEVLGRELVEQTPVFQHTPYSALSGDWDATRGAPTPGTRPEAPNLPSARYEMSHDPELFRATKFRQAPNMPEQRDAPKPIFPWETTAPKATRVFAEDLPTTSSDDANQLPPTTISQQRNQISTTSTSERSQPPVGDPWNSFTRTNAWDDNVSIDRYIRNFKQAQKAQIQGQVQVIHQQESGSAEKDFATAPDSPPIARRRESLILTDFPDANDRPSLPVTPAPIHRQTFWGHERDQGGNLPDAQGVPEQDEWVSNIFSNVRWLCCSRCGQFVPFQPAGAVTGSSKHLKPVDNPPPSVYPNFSLPPTLVSNSGEESTKQVSQTSAVSPKSQPLRKPFFSRSSPNIQSKSQYDLNQTRKLTRGFLFSKDPTERLEELRRSSLVATEDLPKNTPRLQQDIPTRTMPSSSIQRSGAHASTTGMSASDSTGRMAEERQSFRAAIMDPPKSPSPVSRTGPTRKLPSFQESQPDIPTSTDAQPISDTSTKDQELRRSNLATAEDLTASSSHLQQGISTGNLPSSSVSRPALASSTDMQSTGDTTARAEEFRSSNLGTAEEIGRDSSRSQQDTSAINLASSSSSRSNLSGSTDVQSTSDSLARTAELRRSNLETAEETGRDSSRSQREALSHGIPLPSTEISSPPVPIASSAPHIDETRDQNSAVSISRAGNATQATDMGTSSATGTEEHLAHNLDGAVSGSTSAAQPIVTGTASGAGTNVTDTHDLAGSIFGHNIVAQPTSTPRTSSTGDRQTQAHDLAGSTTTLSSAAQPTSMVTSSTTGIDERYIDAMVNSTSGASILVSSSANRSNLPAFKPSTATERDSMRADDLVGSASSVDSSLSPGIMRSDMPISTAALATEASERRANDIASLTAGTGGLPLSSISSSTLPGSPSSLASEAYERHARELSSLSMDAGSTSVFSSIAATNPEADLMPLEALAQELRTSATAISSNSSTYTTDQSSRAVTASVADTRTLESLVQERRTPADLTSSFSSAERAYLLSNTATSSNANTHTLEALVRGSEAQAHLSPIVSTSALATGGDRSYTSELASSRSVITGSPIATGGVRSYPGELASAGSSATGSTLATGGVRSHPSEVASAESSATGTTLASDLEERLAGQLARSRWSSTISSDGGITSRSSLTGQSGLSSSYNASIGSDLASSRGTHGTCRPGVSGLGSSMAGLIDVAQLGGLTSHSTTSGSNLTGGLGHGSTIHECSLTSSSGNGSVMHESSLIGGLAQGSALHESNVGSDIAGSHVSYGTHSNYGTQGTSSSGNAYPTTGATGNTTYSSTAGGNISSSFGPSSAIRFEQSGALVGEGNEPTFVARGAGQLSSTTTSNTTGAAQSSSTVETSSMSFEKREASAPGRLRTDKVGPFDEYEIA